AMTITHDMTSVMAIADQVAMLHDGKIQWCGSRSDLIDSGNTYVDQFINGSVEGPIKTIL
ncbi:MAG: ABC transporter ATP-binding protein, partial [Planktomarina sp.]|nr:ABC transporter ATP-binding protein [Planktomarina sp.]MDT2048931.1 ABC transporter ATP-binding protein [Planktomarina sp.]